MRNKIANLFEHNKYIDKYATAKLVEEKDRSTIDTENIIESEIYSFVHSAMTLLPQRCADVLQLYLDGYKPNEIAIKLNRTEQNVYNIKNEAIKILKRKIDKDKLFIFIQIFGY